MDTTAATAPPPAPSAERARVAFRSHPAPGFVQGGWWPRSLDLGAEAPALVRAVRESGRDVFRLMYSLPAWQRPPRTLVVDGRVVKLGGYNTVDPSVITLVDASGWERVDLLVVPPDTDAAFAEIALAAAGRDEDHRASELLDHHSTTKEA
jgi:Family of unknown function (DUF5994)